MTCCRSRPTTTSTRCSGLRGERHRLDASRAVPCRPGRRCDDAQPGGRGRDRRRRRRRRRSGPPRARGRPSCRGQCPRRGRCARHRSHDVRHPRAVLPCRPHRAVHRADPVGRHCPCRCRDSRSVSARCRPRRRDPACRGGDGGGRPRGGGGAATQRRLPVGLRTAPAVRGGQGGGECRRPDRCRAGRAHRDLRRRGGTADAAAARIGRRRRCRQRDRAGRRSQALSTRGRASSSLAAGRVRSAAADAARQHAPVDPDGGAGDNSGAARRSSSAAPSRWRP